MSNLTRHEIPGFSGHFIDKSGNVWKGQTLKKICVAASGYKVVQFWINGKNITRTLHRLLLITFVGPCPEGLEALHSDGNRLNCDLSNLRWGTRQENMIDAIRHGTATIGVKNARAKLTEDQVREIRRTHYGGKQTLAMAKLFNVTPCTIKNVVNNKTYIGV